MKPQFSARMHTLRYAAPPAGQPRRVVVTGLGAITPFGIGVEHSWNQLLASASAVREIRGFDTRDLSCKIAAQVPRPSHGLEYETGTFQASDYIDPRCTKTQNVDFIAFALAAAKEAIDDAGYSPKTIQQQERAGVAVGSGIGNIDELAQVCINLEKRSYRKVSPFFIPRILLNLPAGHLSIEYGFKGPNHACSTACATGSHSIGDAFRLIRYGDADVMLAGGTESCVNPVPICGFSRARALATKFQDTPHLASRPFDVDRNGFVIGEGAGIVVLEEYEHAKRRKARIYAEIRGYGLSGDGHHITAPPDDGNGALRAMAAAIKQSGLQLPDIGYINAHATSTQLGDRAENEAIKALFGTHAYDMGISSSKGAIGHLLGAAGAVEAIFAIKALHHDVMPPTMNLVSTALEFDLNYVPNVPQKKALKAVLSNSFGFGGTNSSLCFSK